MREPRNPFRLRASESIESDATFLRLFGPGMLDLLPAENLWDKPQVFRSAPGGGKTSLLRLFTPTVLLTLHSSRRLDDVKELWGRMRELDLVDESAPKLLGVYLSCVRNYATLDDIELDNARRDRILFGLLNARITLAMLRASLQLAGLVYPDDLSKLTLGPDLLPEAMPSLAKARDGRDIFEWAVNHETTVCDAIDGFGGLEAHTLPGDDSLAALRLLRPNVLLVDGRPISARTLLMLDDLQQLTHRQRGRLLKTMAEQRTGVAVWLAERFEALSSDEMLESGTTEGRDYEREVLIERFWRKYPRRFESLVMNVANRRAAAAVDVEVNSLDGCLPSTLDGLDWADTFRSIGDTVRARVVAQARETVTFSEWIAHFDSVDSTPRDRALNWRTLEILIAREQRKKQPAFDFPLSREVLAAKDDSQLRAASELFLATEFKLPYYFGSGRLATLASSNLEQFLRLAGDEFEEVIATRVMRKTPVLSPAKQDAVLRAASESVWAEVARRARFGDRVFSLLDSIARFSVDTTYQPNAPYEPGVTGIAISMRDREQLLRHGDSRQSPEWRAVLDVLAAALAQNFLEPILDYRVKGGSWMVLYLNRLLCVRDRLPLHYGGFKEKTLKDIHAWTFEGYRARRKPLLA